MKKKCIAQGLHSLTAWSRLFQAGEDSLWCQGQHVCGQVCGLLCVQQIQILTRELS